MRFLEGGSKMGELMRSTDWEQTAIGAPEDWPESLKSAVSISLNSGFPIAIYWGEDFTLLYNDAWSSIPGDKHPWALGKSGPVVWPEIWEGLDIQFKSVLNKGESIRQPDALLLINRYGYTEECYFDYTLSPIIAADGSVGGVFNAVIETTYRIINDRRKKVLNIFQQKLHASLSTSNAIDIIKAILNQSREDIPFSLLYFRTSASENQTQIQPLTGLENQNLERDWETLFALGDAGVKHLENLDEVLEAPERSLYDEKCKEALIVPLNIGQAKTSGYMLLGLSPRKRLDQDYRQFLETVGVYSGTILNNAYALEQVDALQHEQALNEELAAANEELAAANEELCAINEELQKTQGELQELTRELETRVKKRTEALFESEGRLKNLIEQSTVGMAVFKGDNLVLEIANPPALALADKTSQIIGLPLFEAFPEVVGQPIVDVLYNVYKTGEPFIGYEIPVMLNRKGLLDTFYYNISYIPFIEEGKITGVLPRSRTGITGYIKFSLPQKAAKNLFPPLSLT